MLVICSPKDVPPEGITGSGMNLKLALLRRGTFGGLPPGATAARIAVMALTLTESTTGLRAPRLAPAGRRLGRLAVATSAVAMLLTWAGTPVLAADPSHATRGPIVTGSTTPTERIRTVDLSRDGAAVTQFTSYWCVPAAVQTMLNLITGTSDRSFGTQSRLYEELRRSNRYAYTTRGNDVRGWSRVLTAHLPAGMGYEDVSFTSRSDAYLAIVRTMDRTRRPVGIVVDRATHAWTVVGFTVRETPGVPNSTTVLGFYVVGPLGSPTDPWPKKYLSISQLNARFTPYHEATRPVVWEGLYVIVAPRSVIGQVAPTR
jgi:hypothetical protein